MTGFEDRRERGTSTSRPLNAIPSPLSSVSYEDDFVSSPGSRTLTEKNAALEPRYEYVENVEYNLKSEKNVEMRTVV